MFVGQTKEFRFRFFGLGGSSICVVYVSGVSGGQTKFRGPPGPFAVSRDPLEGPQRPNFTKSGMGFLESTHFLDYISLVPTSGWPVMLFPPPRIRKRAPYGRFGRFPGLSHTNYRPKRPTVQLKSFGSVFLVWVGRLYVCWMSWGFRGVRPSFGVPRAHLHSAETLWKAIFGQISLRVEWGS